MSSFIDKFKLAPKKEKQKLSQNVRIHLPCFNYNTVKGLQLVENILDHYELHEQIGSGEYCTIKRAVNRKVNLTCAAKIISKNTL